jgi:hypothetical protein
LNAEIQRSQQHRLRKPEGKENFPEQAPVHILLFSGVLAAKK